MNLSGKAYQLIRQDIITCVLNPGQQINQGEIAEKYQLGITPVREALTRLSHDGLVAALPRFGYIVSPVTLSDLRELFEYRVLLETGVVKLAVKKATDSQLNILTQKADFSYHYKEIEDHSKFLRLNSAFHESIATLSRNTRLTSSLSSVLDQLTRFFHLGLNLRDSADEMRSEHIRLASALSARDEKGAIFEITQQIDRSQQRILEALNSTDIN